MLLLLLLLLLLLPRRVNQARRGCCYGPCPPPPPTPTGNAAAPCLVLPLAWSAQDVAEALSTPIAVCLDPASVTRPVLSAPAPATPLRSDPLFSPLDLGAALAGLGQLWLELAPNEAHGAAPYMLLRLATVAEAMASAVTLYRGCVEWGSEDLSAFEAVTLPDGNIAKALVRSSKEGVPASAPAQFSRLLVRFVMRHVVGLLPLVPSSLAAGRVGDRTAAAMVTLNCRLAELVCAVLPSAGGLLAARNAAAAHGGADVAEQPAPRLETFNPFSALTPVPRGGPKGGVQAAPSPPPAPPSVPAPPSGVGGKRGRDGGRATPAPPPPSTILPLSVVQSKALKDAERCTRCVAGYVGDELTAVAAGFAASRGSPTLPSGSVGCLVQLRALGLLLPLLGDDEGGEGIDFLTGLRLLSGLFRAAPAGEVKYASLRLVEALLLAEVGGRRVPPSFASDWLLDLPPLLAARDTPPSTAVSATTLLHELARAAPWASARHTLLRGVVQRLGPVFAPHPHSPHVGQFAKLPAAAQTCLLAVVEGVGGVTPELAGAIAVVARSPSTPAPLRTALLAAVAGALGEEAARTTTSVSDGNSEPDEDLSLPAFLVTLVTGACAAPSALNVGPRVIPSPGVEEGAPPPSLRNLCGGDPAVFDAVLRAGLTLGRRLSPAGRACVCEAVQAAAARAGLEAEVDTSTAPVPTPVSTTAGESGGGSRAAALSVWCELLRRDVARAPPPSPADLVILRAALGVLESGGALRPTLRRPPPSLAQILNPSLPLRLAGEGRDATASCVGRVTG